MVGSDIFYILDSDTHAVTSAFEKKKKKLNWTPPCLLDSDAHTITPAFPMMTSEEYIRFSKSCHGLINVQVMEFHFY